MNATLAGVVITAFVAFCRVGGCFLVMPGMSSARVPIQIRLFVALAATGALLIYLWDQIAPHASRNPAVLLALIVSETLIGSLIGLMARLYVLAMQFMATAIAMLMGFGGTGGASIDEPDPQAALVDVTDTVSDAFFLVIRLGSPFVAYAILVHLTIGFVNKLTPQIPIYFISQPFIIAGGMIIFYFAVGTMLSLFVDGFVDLTLAR